MEPESQPRRPRIAVTLGDPSGIGPEVAAKLLSNPRNPQRADIVVLADKSELDLAIQDAGSVHIALSEGGRTTAGPQGVQLLDDGTASEYPGVTRGAVSQASGARSLHQLQRALHLAQAGELDALVFAPLNKSSLKQAGMAEEDELRWFANQLHFEGRTSEINIAGPQLLWTSRVTSHLGLEDVAARITRAAVLETIELTHRLRRASGVERPRLGVCALNPHGGEGGAFGRHELDHIGPAVGLARSRGIDRRRFDAVVTMYHDQGQIAMKLLGFDGGVTVQGGLPIPVATPAHGTAFDIVGENVASAASMQNAFDVAAAMAEKKLQKGIRGLGTTAGAEVALNVVSPSSVAEVNLGC
ncbi:4-hydroxythreonine-4-phosphate dehydrogenase protein [Apiospora phragmitis]|uniref:4-hydroxythreonine-4-phosphate dehydrogenase protein n=1 Tax=Apiospora phragmitis TaxID=2905665 RepID=A0ABR1VJ74_9PEZI